MGYVLDEAMSKSRLITVASAVAAIAFLFWLLWYGAPQLFS